MVYGERPIDVEELRDYKFNNLRSQMWFYAREKFRKGEVRLGVKHMRLVGDLTTPRYTIQADKTVAVESKDSIKKRLGRSPDYGDAFIQALFVREYSRQREITEVELF